MAILTKAQLEALNQSSFPDQSTEAITPAILRTYNTATIDTLVDSLDTGSFVTSAITASSLITASVNLNTITFTKGNGTTFAVTVNTGSGGGTTDISSLNAFTASQLTINSGLNASTASQQISIDNLNTTTASINSSITQLNASSASQQISINALNAATSSYVTSAITASSLITASFSGNTLTFTKGNGTTFGVVIPDVSGSTLPSGLLSSSVTNFTDYSASVDSRINAITASGGIPAGTVSSSAQILNYGIFATTGSNTFIGSQTINGNLNLTGSLTASGLAYPTTAGIAGQFITTNGTNTLSFDDVHVLLEDVRYGENITIGDPLYVSGSNGTRPIVYKADASNTAKMPVIYVASSTAVANTNTTALTLGLITGVTTTGYAEGTTIYVAEGGGWSASRPSGSASIVQSLGIVTKTGAGGSGRGLILNPGPATLPNLQTGYAWAGNGGNQPVAVATSSFSTTIPSGTISGSSQITNLGFVSSSVTASSLVTASFSGNTLTFTKGDASTFGVVIPDISGSTINTGSFATTGSNTFIGDETFSNTDGNGTTLTPFSGSLVFTPKGGLASSSSLQNHLFISASATGQTNITNIIFNTLSQSSPSGSVIISGSQNIFNIPGGNQAGFVRRITTGNLSLGNGTLPTYTSSMNDVPIVYTNNITLNGSATFRGPISSSQYVFNGNNLMGGASLGDATESMVSASAGINFQGNHFLALKTFRAAKTQLSSSVNATSNLFGNTGHTTNLASSSVTYNNNSFYGTGIGFVNAYFAPSAVANNQRVEVLYNLVGGQSAQLYTSGSNTTTTFNRQINNNFIGGNFCIASASANGDNSSLLTNIIYGNYLNVNGNSPYSSGVATVGHGSAFIGRYNANNGTRANSAETIFAVGTGISNGVRKTGFLIDSGSNTFVEGTLNVSGSTSFNGAVNITGSLTSSLTQGYVWVGGAGNVSTLVATSSFSGVTSAITASSLVTASVNLNTITFTKGDASTFAITVDTGSGGGSVPAGTVSSSAQIVAYNKFATTGSNTFNDYQIIKSNLSFQDATGLEDNNIVLSSLNKATLYIQNTSVSSGYNSGSVLQLTTTTGSTGYGSGSAVFQMDAVYEGNTASSKVGSTVGLGSYVQGLADNILFAKSFGFPNTPSTTFKVDAASIELSGSVKVNTGSSGSAGIVSVDGTTGTTVNNGLVTSNSIILATTQELGAGSKYPAVVSGKTNGSFTLNHNFGGNLDVGYLIINPI
jgi:hypothetical protein